MANEEPENYDYRKGSPSVSDLHDSVVREAPLPREGQGGAGVTLLAVFSLILILGGGQLFSTSNGFRDSVYISAHYVPDPRPSLDGIVGDTVELAWIDRWMRDGQRVYSNCVACHQSGGLGIPGQFPPLVGSEWVDGGTKRLGALMLHGAIGPMTVAGQTYNGLMPPWNNLSDAQLAQVITYIRREFGSLPEGEDGVVTIEMIQAAREEFAGQSEPYTEAELLAIPEDADLPGAPVDLETGEPL